VRTLATTEGLAGFYTGWLPTVSRNVPFVVITFSTFAALQQALLRRRPHGRESETRLTFVENLCVGISSAQVTIRLFVFVEGFDAGVIGDCSAQVPVPTPCP
jgi:solute carrier family 25 S-adenosylmethionine transporter 26